MILNELLKLVSSDKAPDIRLDSRLVKTGDIFVAIEGAVCDGHNFIDQAIANGARYIVCQPRTSILDARYSTRRGGESRRSPMLDTEVIVVENSAQAAALLAQAARGNPARRLTSLAVTGTNGKTTVAFLVRSVIANAGEKCGLIGTVLYDTIAAVSQASLTTPDSLALAEMTEQMVDAGAKYMVVEASSHALSQYRLAGINFKAVAFTNLTGDHLDYHKTLGDYLAAKTKLFEGLSKNAVAVLNKESLQSATIAGKTAAKILWYAVEKSADITAHIESMDMTGTVFVIEYAGQKQKVKSPLIGRYNVSNHLAAAGLSLAAGFDLQTIAAGLSALRDVPGRLQKVDWGGDFTVLIDYAHTDDALKNVLSALKPLCSGRLAVVFGCGGDRDRTKRPRMAETAERLADSVIVTSDNPRNERPENIINEIVAGFQDLDSGKITIEPDRKKAIELAIRESTKGDIVLIAGKGHENYQIIGKQRFNFSDKTIAEQCLKKLKV